MPNYARLKDGYVTCGELSEIVGLSSAHIRHLVRNNRIPGKKVGRRWYFNPKHVESILVHEKTVAGYDPDEKYRDIL